MEPDVIRMFSSSPPPMDEAADEEEDEEFGDFGTFSSVSVSGCSVPNSISFSEFDTPTTFNQTQALNATSPPALNHTSSSRPVIGPTEGLKANGHACGAKNGSKRTETLTNGFQASPTSQKSAPFSQDEEEEEEDFADFAAFSDKPHAADSDETRSGEFDDRNAVNQNQETAQNPNRTETDFANFAAFSKDSDGTLDDTQSETPCSHRDGDAALQTHHSVPNRTESEFADFHAFPDDCTLRNHLAGSETAESLSKEDEDPADDVAFCPEREKTRPNEDCSSLNENAFDASGSVCSSDLASESDSGVENLEGSRPVVTALNGTAEKDKDGGLDGGGSETETETSFGRPLSTEALEEFGDISTTASVASPPLQEETATPTGEEEDEEEFGDFGDCLAAQEFSNFEQEQPENTQGLGEDDDFGDFNSTKIKMDDKTEQQSSSHENAQDPQTADEDFEDFGDFNSPKFSVEQTGADFPSSESFGNFSTAAEETEETEERGWSAFGGEESRGGEAEGESWAAFSSEEATEEPLPVPIATASRSERLEQLFHSSFPQTLPSPSADDETQTTLNHLLEPEPSQTHSSVCVRVWAQLQDIHEALGLRFQWGGSFCNKALLCSLGIDTRNILFTGQKKQPVIVPMYAAGLGMLEPVKPVSAAEMIASIAHNSPCSSDSVQEALPPVQFDWSSSGLTNPLDASGGSSLLNLDFFGPVDDSESGAASIPGVDPELFELTTAKLDQSKVSDAFAKLMSTVQPTTARRPRPEENLSEEALKVISRFPDLSFMTAKVLMFPTTLTPRGVHTGAEAGASSESGPGSEPGLDQSAD